MPKTKYISIGKDSEFTHNIFRIHSTEPPRLVATVNSFKLATRFVNRMNVASKD